LDWISISPFPPSSTYRAAAWTQSLPDQNKSTMALWMSRPLGGVTSVSLGQKVMATKALATRTLPRYNNWGSFHFRVHHFQPLLPHSFELKSTRETGGDSSSFLKELSAQFTRAFSKEDKKNVFLTGEKDALIICIYRYSMRTMKTHK